MLSTSYENSTYDSLLRHPCGFLTVVVLRDISQSHPTLEFP